MANLASIEEKAKAEFLGRSTSSLRALARTKSRDLLPRHVRCLNFSSEEEARRFEQICDAENIPCYRTENTKKMCYLGGTYEILFVEFGDPKKNKHHPWSIEMMKKYDK